MLSCLVKNTEPTSIDNQAKLAGPASTFLLASDLLQDEFQEVYTILNPIARVIIADQATLYAQPILLQSIAGKIDDNPVQNGSGESEPSFLDYGDADRDFVTADLLEVSDNLAASDTRLDNTPLVEEDVPHTYFGWTADALTSGLDQPSLIKSQPTSSPTAALPTPPQPIIPTKLLHPFSHFESPSLTAGQLAHLLETALASSPLPLSSTPLGSPVTHNPPPAEAPKPSPQPTTWFKSGRQRSHLPRLQTKSLPVSPKRAAATASASRPSPLGRTMRVPSIPRLKSALAAQGSPTPFRHKPRMKRQLSSERPAGSENESPSTPDLRSDVENLDRKTKRRRLFSTPQRI